MPRTFAYLRVSTAGQATDNQLGEIKAAGFKVDNKRVVSETVSGSSAIEQRLEHDDVLIVTRLDRLGRNAIDVTLTVAKLEAMGVKVHCLALGGVDLTSSAGKMTMAVITAVAEFERDLIIERTQAGLARAVAGGAVLGRKPRLTPDQKAAARAQLAAGASISAVARSLNVSRLTVMRAKNEVN
jgi:putative DNA-invertase from lambdoid prophage Rac